MDLRSELAHFRADHDEILRFLQQWEVALNQAASPDVEQRRKGLADLVEMEPRLLALREHCREEEREDARLQLYLDEEVFSQLRSEHELLERMTQAFRDELRVVTAPPPVDNLVARGRELLSRLRYHVAFEEGLLKQIEDGAAAMEGFELDASVLPE